MARCPQCKKDYSFLESLGFTDSRGLCSKCAPEAIKMQEQPQQKAQRPQSSIQERANAVILTTTHSVEGHPIEKYLGIESVEIVLGTGILSEIAGELSDLFGQRSKGFESKLAQAKKAACKLLQLRAAEKGANAVVGIDMDFTEFSGNRVGLILNGTLVKVLEPY